MIQLLFMAVAAEAAVVVLLLVKTPLRRVVLLALDRIKRGRGPVAVRTVAATVSVVLASSLYSMLKIQRRAGGEEGPVAAVSLSPTDQVLWTRHLLEASLMEGQSPNSSTSSILFLDANLQRFSIPSSAEMFECSGYFLFLALIIDRMHHYIRELRVLRKTVEAVTKRNKVAEEPKDGASDELKARDREIIQLKSRIAQLESEPES